jgi:hypothetical protein
LFDDILSYRLVNNPNWVTVTFSGLINGVPGPQDLGEANFRVDANDGKGGTATQTVKIRVIHTNHAPTIVRLISPPNGVVLQLNSSIPLRFSWTKAIDIDPLDTLRYVLVLKGPNFDTTIVQQDTLVDLGIATALRAHSEYWWTVQVIDGLLSVASPDTFRLKTSYVTSVTRETNGNTPTDLVLFQNYPNPFNPSTTLRYGIPTRCHVRLEVFNILGQKVDELIDDIQDVGFYQVTWRAELASGMYIYRLQAISTDQQSRRFIRVNRMILVR